MTREPALEVVDIILGWDVSETSLTDPPEIYTGAWDRDGRHPAIAVGSSTNEGPIISATGSGYFGTDGATGKGMQRLTGYVMVECVAGSRADLEGAGEDGHNLNPKSVAWELYDHATDLVIETQQAGDLFTLSPGTGRRLVDTDGPSVVFRYQFPVRYMRDRLPPA